MDMPVSNPFLTDKLIDEELKQMMDMQVSEKRMGCVLRINFRKGIVFSEDKYCFLFETNLGFQHNKLFLETLLVNYYSDQQMKCSFSISILYR